MKNLIRGDEDAWALFKAIRDAKYTKTRNILVGLSVAVERRYAQYDQNKENLEHILDATPPFAAQEEHALRHCYQSETEPLKLLTKRIKERQSRNAQSRCQYCGIHHPGTFDHYLPFSSFPEFSVHPDNLLPCCPECNGLRGTNWRENGERRHINLYFDEIEEGERFLVASIVFHGGELASVRFDVDPARGANQAFVRRYERHCRTLNLLKRFEDRAPAHLDTIRAYIHGFAESSPTGAEEIMRKLRRVAAEQQHLLGANNWEVALLVAAAESREFIDYCLRPVGDTTGKAST